MCIPLWVTVSVALSLVSCGCCADGSLVAGTAAFAGAVLLLVLLILLLFIIVARKEHQWEHTWEVTIEKEIAEERVALTRMAGLPTHAACMHNHTLAATRARTKAHGGDLNGVGMGLAARFMHDILAADHAQSPSGHLPPCQMPSPREDCQDVGCVYSDAHNPPLVLPSTWNPHLAAYEPIVCNVQPPVTAAPMGFSPTYDRLTTVSMSASPAPRATRRRVGPTLGGQPTRRLPPAHIAPLHDPRAPAGYGDARTYPSPDLCHSAPTGASHSHSPLYSSYVVDDPVDYSGIEVPEKPLIIDDSNSQNVAGLHGNGIVGTNGYAYGPPQHSRRSLRRSIGRSLRSQTASPPPRRGPSLAAGGDRSKSSSNRKQTSGAFSQGYHAPWQYMSTSLAQSPFDPAGHQQPPSSSPTPYTHFDPTVSLSPPHRTSSHFDPTVSLSPPRRTSSAPSPDRNDQQQSASPGAPYVYPYSIPSASPIPMKMPLLGRPRRGPVLHPSPHQLMSATVEDPPPFPPTDDNPSQTSPHVRWE